MVVVVVATADFIVAGSGVGIMDAGRRGGRRRS